MAGRKQRRSDKTRLTYLQKREAKSTNQWLADLPREGASKDDSRRAVEEAISSGFPITRIEPAGRQANRKESGWPDTARTSGIRKIFKAPKV